MKVFITRAIFPIAKEILGMHFHVDEHTEDRAMSREELISAVKNYDGILCMLSDCMDREVLSRSGKLKVLSNYAVGLDNIDLAYAKEKGIAVYNVPDIVTTSTADMTLALLLSFMRKIPNSLDFVRQDKWRDWQPDLFLGEELEGKTFGVLGYGRIGEAVARRVLGFGAQVIAYNRSPPPKERLLNGLVQQVNYEELLEKSDYLSLHLPLTEESRGMVNLHAMKKMTKKPLLINMARGAIVNTDDLVTALREGILRGALLDVTDPEPLRASHPLCSLPNCFVAPHLGTATVECRSKMAFQAAENLISGLQKSLSYP